MKKCMIILNPSSGKEQAKEYEYHLKKQLHHYDITILETEKEGDAKKYAQQACHQNYDVLILVGGDGTLNEGINGIASEMHRPIVGVVPLGTVNDFARALGVPLAPEEAIEKIGGRIVEADIGEVNGHYFTNIIAIGKIAEAVGHVSVEQKTALGSLAYLVEGAKATIKNETFKLKIESDTHVLEEDAIIFLCVLTNSVGGFSHINEEASITDGLLHSYIIKGDNVLQTLLNAKDLFLGNKEDCEDILKFEANEISITTKEPKELNIDGDMVGQTPAKIRVLPKHIRFFV